MRQTIQDRAALWEQVWAEYDARHAGTPALIARAAPVPKPRRRAPWRGLRLCAAFALLGLVGAYATAPFIAAAQLGEALASGDAARIAGRVDWAGLRPALPASGLDGQAGVFLAAMADDIARGMATPAGLAELGRERMAHATTGLSMIGAIRPISAGRMQVSLHGPAAREEAMSVTLALTDPWRLRWQMVGFHVPARVAAL